MKPLFAFFPPSLPCALALAAIMAALPTTARAENWEKIASDGSRTVEIDSSVIFDSDNGAKVSWGRIVLNDSEAKQAGYRTIKAMNRYDCLGRSFTTIKRVYMDDHNDILREETLSEQRPMAVRNNSVDEQIWRKVCGPSAAPALSNRSKATPNAMNQLSELADTAHRAARNSNATSALPAAQRLPMPTSAPAATAPPDASPASRRGSATTQPFVLPAPAASAQNTAGRQPPALSQNSSEDWGYFGAVGPEFWGKLRPEWKVCAEGKRQSPIDFVEGKPITVNLDPVKFDYRPTSFVITNSHRMLRIKVSEGMSMEARGQRYALEGFILHRPAETRIDNKIAEMEAHFFHRNDKGQIAVLAVQFVRGSKPDASLQTLLDNLPLERGDSYAPQSTLNMAAFLPTNPAHYLYMGSLTMPPCTEGVLWVVMKEAMTLSEEQYEIFFRLHEDNARPPQPASGRLILESR